jgi:hypothetical protein
LTRDAQYAVAKAFLKRACAIGRRRPNLADFTI